MIFFGLIAVISSVSACAPPSYDLDEGHKTFNYKNYDVHTSWFAYRYYQDKDDTIMIYNMYKLKNKKNKTISRAYVSYDIEKIKKNRIKFTTTYSSEPQIDKVKIYKTNLSVKAFYWKHIETQFTRKIDKKAFYKEIVIDKGEIKATLPYNVTNPKDNPENITKIRHYINWVAKTYTKFPNMIYIRQNYDNNAPATFITVREHISGGSYEYYYPAITIQKINKNMIKIKIGSLYKLNGDIIKHRTYNVKTNLSLKKYYLKVFKPKMVKMISLN